MSLRWTSSPTGLCPPPSSGSSVSKSAMRGRKPRAREAWALYKLCTEPSVPVLHRRLVSGFRGHLALLALILKSLTVTSGLVIAPRLCVRPLMNSVAYRAMAWSPGAPHFPRVGRSYQHSCTDHSGITRPCRDVFVSRTCSENVGEDVFGQAVPPSQAVAAACQETFLPMRRRQLVILCC